MAIKVKFKKPIDYFYVEFTELICEIDNDQYEDIIGIDSDGDIYIGNEDGDAKFYVKLTKETKDNNSIWIFKFIYNMDPITLSSDYTKYHSIFRDLILKYFNSFIDEIYINNEMDIQ